MTPATPGPSLFSTFTSEQDGLYRPRKQTFLLSLIGQAAMLALVGYFTANIARTPEFRRDVSDLAKFHLTLSGFNDGGGGNHDLLPVSAGSPPRASPVRSSFQSRRRNSRSKRA